MYKSKSLRLINFLSHQDSHFEFHDGRAMLVVGRNEDKEGQKSNGAGKSSLNEAISVAVTGSSIRDVKTRELVRRGEEFAIIEYVLYNTLYRCELKIQRKLYTKTTQSSECKIWENGEEVRTCADINAYNKFVLDMIGISKEDFFNFYLITKEYYKPFLSIGDVTKKSIINRFSGADSVDAVEPLITSDLAEQAVKVKLCEDNLLSNRTKQQVLAEQCTELELSFSSEALEKKKVEIEGQIVVLQNNLQLYLQNIESIKNKLTDVNSSILILQGKIQTSESKIQSTIKESEVFNKQYESKTSESSKVPDLFVAEINEIQELELDCKTTINSLTPVLDKYVAEKASFENQLVGLIDCPKCSHQFTLKNKDISVEEVRKQIASKQLEIDNTQLQIKEYEEILKDLEPQKNTINQNIIEKRKLIKLELDQIQLKINEFNTQLTSLRSSLSTLQSELQIQTTQRTELDGNLSSYQLKCKQTEDSIKLLEDSLGNLLTEQGKSKLVEINKKIELLVLEEVQLKEQFEVESKLSSEIDSWFVKFKNFKSHLANQSIKNITDYTNLFLNAIHSNITIKVEGYRLLANKKLKEEITTTVFRDGFESGSYGSFSSGERGRIDICCILALQELINLNCKSGGLDLLICDEILDSVDVLGLEYIVSSLQPLGRTIMIVSQNEINSQSENTITMVKRNGITLIQ